MTALPDSLDGMAMAWRARMTMNRRMLAAACLAFAFLSIEEANAQVATVTFAGMTWTIKDSAGQLQGPGPNYFSRNNVSVDPSTNALHLKIRRETVEGEERWTCAEVIAPISFGFGTYRFTVASNIDALHPRAVLGMFVFDTNPMQKSREIDIEASRFGDPTRPTNTQYVVQPAGSNLFRFFTPGTDSIHQFTWSRKNVFFQSFDSAKDPIAEFRSRKAPSPGNEKTRINLWLAGGLEPEGLPSDGEIEMVISNFQYIPPGGSTVP